MSLVDLNRRKCIVLDIETKADEIYLAREGVRDEIRDSIRVPGDYTKTESIAAYLDSALAEKMAKAALDPQLGRIVAIGYADLWDDDDIDCTSGENEPAVLEAFARLCSDKDPRVVGGWNVRLFDIPFITARCVVHGIHLPTWWPHSRNYAAIADVMELLAPEHGARLKNWLRRCDLPAKTADGSEVASMTIEQIHAYCLNDVHVERLLLRRCAWAIPQAAYTKPRATYFTS